MLSPSTVQVLFHIDMLSAFYTCSYGMFAFVLVSQVKTKLNVVDSFFNLNKYLLL